MDACSLCENPMTPGQRRAEDSEGRKAHSSCVALVSQDGMLPHLREMVDLAERAAATVTADLLPTLVSEEVKAAVAEITGASIPSKAVQLRRLLTHAAEGLDRQVSAEAKQAEYSRKLTPAIVASMVEASTVLRVMSIYVMDD